MRLAIFVYHKNIFKLYPQKWIDEFRDSILNQNYKDYDILEINYGGGQERIFENSFFKSKELPTFADALNYLFDKAIEGGHDCAANTNCDDSFRFDRFEKQIKYIENGYDLVSSNFSLLKDDSVCHTHYFDGLDIRKELARDHNILCHPVLMWSKKFILSNRYNPAEIPLEDMRLWQRTMWNYRFVILPDILCHHRLHNNSVGHNLKEA